MYSKKNSTALGRKIPVGKKHLAVAVGLVMAAQAQGIEFYAGGVEGNLGTQLSMGSSWRLEEQNKTLLGDPNINNGNANYQKNDAFSQTFNARNDLQVSYENFGAIVSAKYWYDAALENDDSLDDSDYHELAKFSGARIMDAYVYGEFEVLDMPMDVRLGKQVISWGDSTFIPGGINSVNPYDLSAFSRPGAKLKDAVIPVSMAFANVGLTDNLSAEVFYQLEFHETVLEGCGTYFSVNDNFATGCDGVEIISAEVMSALSGGAITDALLLEGSDDLVRRPSSDGQFGIALRYVSEALDTEFGLYAMNIHSRTPVGYGTMASATRADLSAAMDSAVIASLTSDATGSSLEADLEAAGNGLVLGDTATAGYHIAYTEDVQIMGLSFATEIATMSISGELSHQLDVPYNINDQLGITALVAANATVVATAGGISALAGDVGNTAAYLDAAVAELLANGTTEEQYAAQQFAAYGPGEVAAGFRLFDVSQLQLTAIKLFDQTLGADSVFAIVEAGYTFVHDLDDSASARETFEGSSDADANTVTQNAWGYRAIIGADYTDLIAGITLSPELFISHDVDGVSGAANSGFIEGNKRIGLTLNATMSNDLTASVSYNQLTGGDNDRVSDRDFASVSVGMQF